MTAVSKAFDTIAHYQLLKKLNLHFGFGHSAFKLLKQYHENRYRCVKINSSMSTLIGNTYFRFGFTLNCTKSRLSLSD